MSNKQPSLSRLVPPARAARLDPASLLPAAIQFDDTDTPADVVDALILAAAADGRQPYARTTRLQQIRPGVSLTPPDAQTFRVAINDGHEARLAAGDGWTVRAVLWRGGDAEVTVTAVTEELAGSVLARVTTEAAAERSVEDGRVTAAPIASVRPPESAGLYL